VTFSAPGSPKKLRFGITTEMSLLEKFAVLKLAIICSARFRDVAMQKTDFFDISLFLFDSFAPGYRQPRPFTTANGSTKSWGERSAPYETT
jgi:hypothetical protein